MRRLVFGILVSLASLTATSCASTDEETTVEVEVQVNLCVSPGSCSVLQVPDAEVALNTQDGRQVATARSAKDGIARLRLDENTAGQHVVVVKTPLWKEKQQTYHLLVVAGSVHTLSQVGHLGETCCGP